MFDGFELRRVPTPRGEICARVGGEGPPLLLLHGYPETHVMWRDVAPALAERFTVVAADLPGYGDSFRPVPAEDHLPHSKRALAADLVEAMIALGFTTFAVAGHDRGARVAYRMALDHPDTVTRLAVLDIAPTGAVWAHADRLFALGYWHWGFLAQPAPLPERLIGSDPDAYFDHHVRRIGLGTSEVRYPSEVMAAYRAQFDDPAVIEAICEDYRAGASCDVEHDAEGGTIACPVLALWGRWGAMEIFYPDLLELWRPLAPGIEGHGLDASHFLVEDLPEEVGAELLAFFAAGLTTVPRPRDT